jgi:hypothetical protein
MAMPAGLTGEGTTGIGGRVLVGGGVLVAVEVAVRVAVFVGVDEGVNVWVGVLVAVLVEVAVDVLVGVLVGVCVGVLVGVLVGVWVGGMTMTSSSFGRAGCGTPVDGDGSWHSRYPASTIA